MLSIALKNVGTLVEVQKVKLINGGEALWWIGGSRSRGSTPFIFMMHLLSGY